MAISSLLSLALQTTMGFRWSDDTLDLPGNATLLAIPLVMLTGISFLI